MKALKVNNSRSRENDFLFHGMKNSMKLHKPSYATQE